MVLIEFPLLGGHDTRNVGHVILYPKNWFSRINLASCIGWLEELFLYFYILLFLVFLFVDLIGSWTWSCSLNQLRCTDRIVLGAVGKRVQPEPKIGGQLPFIYALGFSFQLIYVPGPGLSQLCACSFLGYLGMKPPFQAPFYSTLQLPGPTSSTTLVMLS